MCNEYGIDERNYEERNIFMIYFFEIHLYVCVCKSFDLRQLYKKLELQCVSHSYSFITLNLP